MKLVQAKDSQFTQADKQKLCIHDSQASLLTIDHLLQAFVSVVVYQEMLMSGDTCYSLTGMGENGKAPLVGLAGGHKNREKEVGTESPAFEISLCFSTLLCHFSCR